MDYKERLKEFNSRNYYMYEASFMIRLMEPKNHEYILDYGCGLGRLTWYIKDRFSPHTFGFDVNDYVENRSEFVFREKFDFKFHKIFFMHSIAHIPMIEAVLKNTIYNMLYNNGEIIIMTPNKTFLELPPIKNNNHNKDETVLRHFDIKELNDMVTHSGFILHDAGGWGKFLCGHHERIFIKAIKV